MVEEEKINITDYLISGEVFFVEVFGFVELWFTQAWRADDFERRVLLYCLGWCPVERKGEFF